MHDSTDEIDVDVQVDTVSRCSPGWGKSLVLEPVMALPYSPSGANRVHFYGQSDSEDETNSAHDEDEGEDEDEALPLLPRSGSRAREEVHRQARRTQIRVSRNRRHSDAPDSEGATTQTHDELDKVNSGGKSKSSRPCLTILSYCSVCSFCSCSSLAL